MFDSKPLVKLACRGFLIAIPVIAIVIVSAVITFWGFGINRLGGNFIVLHELAPVPERRLAGFAAVCVPVLFSLGALWHLFWMFRQYSRTQMVAIQTIRHLRAFCTYSVLTAVTAFLLSGVLRWAMGVFDDAPLWTHLGLSVSHMIVLFAAAIIYLATYLIEEGYRHGEEIREYV